MARPKKLVPSYLRHSSGQARVLISGKYHYLGKYGSPESKVEYGRLVALMQSGQPIPSKKLPKSRDGITVGELVLRYISELQATYKGPRVPSQVSVMRSAVRPLLEIYCDTPARDFGPLALAAVRNRMVELMWARSTINNQVSRLKQIWKRNYPADKAGVGHSGSGAVRSIQTASPSAS